MKRILYIQMGIIAIIGSVLVLAGCNNQFSPSQTLQENLRQGNVVIRIANDDDSRTLFPQMPVFSRYKLVFTPENGEEGIEEWVIDTDSTFSLAVGDWTITVIAYVDVRDIEGIPDDEYEAARGSETMTVSSGENNITIDIRSGVEDGEGIFNYTMISLPDTINTATLKILTLTGEAEKEIDLLANNNTGYFVIDSGYYILHLELENDESTICKVEVIHIYRGLTTIAEGAGYIFTESDFWINIPAAFTGLEADGSGTETTTKLTLTFDKDIDGLTAADVVLTPALTKESLTRTDTGVYELTVSGITANIQVSASVSKDGYIISPDNHQVMIYCTNAGIIIGDPSVKLYLDENLLQSGSTLIAQGTGTYTVSIAPGTYTSIVWYLNGTKVAEGQTRTSIVLSKRQEGTYQVTVEATPAGGNKNTGSHSFNVQFVYQLVPVTNITGVPVTATVGTALTLTGTVYPANATNKDISWSLVSGSASIDGNILTPNDEGTVVVRATISSGISQDTDYTDDFYITVNAGGQPAADYTGTYTGSLMRSDFSQMTMSATFDSDSISGADLLGGGMLTIPNVTVSDDNVIRSSGIRIGTWAYVYSDGVKMGIAVHYSYSSITIRQLILGKTNADTFNSGFTLQSDPIITSDMDNTYSGILSKN